VAREQEQGRRAREAAISRGEGHDVVVGVVLTVEFAPGVDHCVFEEVGFDGAEAAFAPLSVDHFFDQVKLDQALGLKLIGVGGEQFVVCFAGFGGEDDACGVEAVPDGVLGGDLAALFGCGAV
jgi:hypothetical protein